MLKSAVASSILILCGFCVAYAQSELPVVDETFENSEVDTEFTKLLESAKLIGTNINDVRDKLGRVIEGEGNVTEAVNNEFAIIEQQVSAIISELRDNGELLDKLRKAKAVTEEFRNDLVRQNATNGGKEEDIVKLEAAIKDFGEKRNHIVESRSRIQQAYYALASRKNEIIEQRRIEQVLDAQSSIDTLLGSLDTLLDSINQLEPSPSSPAVAN